MKYLLYNEIIVNKCIDFLLESKRTLFDYRYMNKTIDEVKSIQIDQK